MKKQLEDLGFVFDDEYYDGWFCYPNLNGEPKPHYVRHNSLREHSLNSFLLIDGRIFWFINIEYVIYSTDSIDEFKQLFKLIFEITL